MNMDQLSALLLAQGAGGNGNALPPLHNNGFNLNQFQGSSQGPSDAALLSLLGGASQAQQASSGTDTSESGLIQALLQHQQQQQLQKQREEQEKALLLQKLKELTNPTPQATSREELAMLILKQQQQQQQQLQNPGYGMLGGSNPLLSANLSANFAASSQAATQLDAAALTKLLQAQHAGASTTNTNPNVPTAPVGLSAVAAASTGLASPSQALELGANSSMPLMAGDRRRKGRTGTFPQKLHQMLSDLERQDRGAEIASFLPHGRAFAIHKPRDFVKHVMPKYFRMSRFSSFQRQLNLYDFQRITEGPDKGSYYHELFVQGRPILSTMMKRNKIKGIKNKKNEGNADASANDDDASDGEGEDL